MGWEARGSGLYYYEKAREGRRVVSRYVGGGRIAQLADVLNLHRRADAERERERRLDTLAPVDAALSTLAPLEREARRLTTATLIAAGFHTHRGQWRRRRPSADETMPRKKKADGPEPGEGFALQTSGLTLLSVQPEEATKRALALLRRCNVEDPAPEDVRALRAWLREGPDPYRRAFDLAALAREAALTASAGGNGVMQECARLGLERMQDELAGPGGLAAASPLERVLIEQAGVCWLTLQDVQRRYSKVTAGGYRFAEAEHFEKRLSAAHRRFVRSVEALARVRRLARRPMQVNVAAPGGTFQQVNQ